MSLSSRITELQEKKCKYLDELDELHLVEPSERWYKQRRYEIESQIAMIESVIDDLEQEQKMMRPLFWMLVGFIVIACGLLVYTSINLN